MGEVPASGPPASAPAPVSGADGWFLQGLRGFGPLGVFAILVILLIGNDHLLPLSALLAMGWAWATRTPWSDLGFVRPRSWPRTVFVGLVFGVAFKLVMKSVVMPLLG